MQVFIMTDITQALEGIKNKVNNQIDKMNEDVKSLNDQVLELAQKGSSAGSLTMSTKSQPSIGSVFTKSDGFKAFKKGAQNTSGQIFNEGMSFKALTSLQGSATATGVDVLPDRISGVVSPAFAPTNLLSILPSMPMTSNSLSFTRTNGFVNAATYQTYEGDTKAEQVLTPANIVAPIATLAVHTSASKQVINDEVGLVSSIDRILRSAIIAKTESEIINGSGGAGEIDGLLNQATTFVPTATEYAEKVGQAIVELQANGYSPDVICLNPTDWFTIRSERVTAGGEYVTTGWDSSAANTIYGVPVVVCPTLAIGTAIVLDSSYTQLLDRESPSILMSSEHGTNFTSNLVTILAELRMGLAVFDQGAVLKLAFV